MKDLKFSNQNEKSVWNYIVQNQPVGVNDIVNDTNISKPTTIKILRLFKELNLINYPPRRRGKSTRITIKQAEFNRIFTKLKNIPKTYIEAPVEPLIIQTKNGKIYCGLLDDYENKGIFLWESHIFRKNKWSIIENGSPMHELLFELFDISSVYTVYPENLGLDTISLEDVMNLWKDQSHEVIRGIDCPWSMGDKSSKGTPHSENCDSKLHEALSDVYGNVIWDTSISTETRKKFEKSMEFLIGYLVNKGNKIPWKNN